MSQESVRIAYSGGVNPFINLPAFYVHCKRRYPNLSDIEFQRLLKIACGRRQQRIPGLNASLFGRDIMTDDVESINSWQYLLPGDKRRVMQHPVSGGEKADHEKGKVAKLEMLGKMNRKAVNRSVLISLDGLELTYVWCRQNGWEQDVLLTDWELIRTQSPATASRFHNVSELGPYVDVRTYGNAHVIERHEARTRDEMVALLKDHSRKPQWSGVNTPKE